jgi:glycosyltransferase involved in cell wall biosynthesis
MRGSILAQLVEPVLITYNRSVSLSETLNAFFAAGWGDNIFHVLDNASTDGTMDVVRSFQECWPNLRYHRNAWNIGGNANIMRAVEISQSEYHWVIGDDDAWFFAGADELQNVLAEKRADIIRLGWLVGDDSRGKYVFAKDLANSEKLFFSSTSMISATILRRSLVTKCLPEAYQNISNSFPQLLAVMRGAESGALVYSLNQNYMKHTPSNEPGYFFGDLELYASWYSTARYLKQAPLKSLFLREISYLMTMNRRGVFKQLTWFSKVALNAKGMGVPQWPYLLSMLGCGKGARAPVVLAMVAYTILPGVLARWLRLLYRKLNGMPTTNPSEARSRL